MEISSELNSVDEEVDKYRHTHTELKENGTFEKAFVK